MFLKRYSSYAEAEKTLCKEIVARPEFITDSTFEILSTGFILTNPWNNKNDHSNYDYAQKFFDWIMTGEKELSAELIAANPWTKRFVDSKGLPDSFSTSYGWKIKHQWADIIRELVEHVGTRRAYTNILVPDDKIVFNVKTTMEYPCTIGFQFLIREGKLIMIVNMRSNNVYAVMPYDVFNFTSLQQYIAKMLKIDVGDYYHIINNAHLYKGDVRRLKELFYAKN